MRDPNPLKNLVSSATQVVVKEAAYKYHVLFSTWYNRARLEDLPAHKRRMPEKEAIHPEDALCIRPKGMMEE